MEQLEWLNNFWATRIWKHPKVVANAIMNRQRGLTGGISYAKELGFNPLDFIQERFATDQTVAWLDLCCGAGRALIQAAQICQAGEFAQKVNLIGVDLIPMFDRIPKEFNFLKLEKAALRVWQSRLKFDLISCVHGLHYVGDKLGFVMPLRSSWTGLSQIRMLC